MKQQAIQIIARYADSPKAVCKREVYVDSIASVPCAEIVSALRFLYSSTTLEVSFTFAALPPVGEKSSSPAKR